MAGKRDKNKDYAVHGDGLETVPAGLDSIGMEPSRKAAALRIVGQVLEANSVVDFYWYRTDGTDELSCYWDDWEKSILWVTRSEVHVRAADDIVHPRPTNWTGLDGALVGWMLPGSQGGPGGDKRQKEIDTVLCPEQFVHVPAGEPCSHCEVVHEPAG